MNFEFIIETGTIEMLAGTSSTNYAFTVSHQNVPKVTLQLSDNQNVFVSNVTLSQMTIEKSSEDSATIHFQAVSKGKK
tara:strand:- start:233 stop:466 length:234 start_codon:yes stop_codon:yes gene_type:complete